MNIKEEIAAMDAKLLHEAKIIIKRCDDNEIYHRKMDSLVTHALRLAGFAKFAKEYSKARKSFWYA